MDRALRGNRLTKQRVSPEKGRQRDTRRDSDDAWHESLSSTEALGIYVSGGMKGKPHSTTEGRKAAGGRHLKRFWSQFEKKKKGTPV